MDHGPDVIPLSIAIIGDGTVGKSALLFVYTHHEFNEQYIPTVVDTYRVALQLKDRRLLLDIYDTASGYGEFLEDILVMNLNQRDVAILCYDCVNRNSFINVQSHWVPLLQNLSNPIPFVVVGTKLDLYRETEVEHVHTSEATRTAMICGAYQALRCSSKLFSESRFTTGDVEGVFKAAIKIGLLKQGIIKGSTCCLLL